MTEEQSQRADAQVSSDTLLALVEQLCRELNPGQHPRVTPDSALDRDLGFDSLTRAELLLRIEQAFNISLSEQVLASAETPRDLLRAARAARPSQAKADTAVIKFESGEVPALAQIEEVLENSATLLEVLEWHVQQHPDRPHVYLYQGESDEQLIISYRTLYDKARSIAAGLQARGVEPHQNVAIMLPTGAEYLYSFYAILICGAAPVPVYPPTRPSQLEDHLRRQAGILNNAQVNLLITIEQARRVANLLKAQVPLLREVVTCEELSQIDLEPQLPQIKAEDTAFIQYTSGSTGQPKGVVLTHADLLTNIRIMGQVNRVTSEDCFVSWLPLYHDMGLIGAWLGSLCYAMQLVLMSPLAFLSRPSYWLWTIHRHRATLSAGPNFAYELCLNKIQDSTLEGLDLSCLRRVYNGAEPVNPTTLRRFCERFAHFGFRAEAMAPVYGLAEATVGLAFPPADRSPIFDRVKRDTFMTSGIAQPESDPAQPALEFPACGQPLPGYQFRVVDDAGIELPERREGLLQFTGPSATQGYFRNPEATEKLFDGEWLNTGDLAYIVKGDLYLTGRVKDLIIRGGRNIYPYELEEAVGDLADVRKGCVAVFGATSSAAQMEEAGSERLIVVAESRLIEQRQPEQARIEQIIREVRRVSADLIALPADEVIVAPPHTVLKTSSGKIRRSAMRDLYQQGLLQPGKLRKQRRGLWWQLLQLNLASLQPRWRRIWQRVKDIAFASYAFLIFAILAPLAWTTTVCQPRLNWRWRCMRNWAKLLFRLTGVPITVAGAKEILLRQHGVIVANHSSYLDGVLLVAVLPKPVVFVAKKELESNVFARLFLEGIGAQFVERFDAKQGLEDAKKLIELLNAGESLLYFPEGTFTRSPGLLPFRMGAFTTAADNQLPIIPIIIRGTRSILRGNDFFSHRDKVRVQFQESITTDKTGWAGAIELRDATRELMLSRLGEPDLKVSPLQDWQQS